jgi:dCMP deaminase
VRPSKWKVLMDVADAIKQRSHDAETHVGAVLVNNKSGAIMSTGFNGFARGADDTKLPNTRPEKYKYIIHAEENLVANCAQHGISMNDCTVVCTLSPCVKCMRLLWQCGISKVVVKEKYKDFEDLKVMGDIGIDIKETDDGYYELTYKTE